MDSGVRCCLHLLEYCQGWLVVGTQLQHVTKMQSSFLEMTVCLQYLTKLAKKLVISQQ